MDAFKERVSQGTVNLATVEFFLDLQYKDCLASPAATPKEAMQSAGAASTILQWLWSSGMEDTGIFLRNQSVVNHLVRFLIAEGQQSRILHWLRRCHNTETPFSSLHGLESRSIQNALFLRLIKEEILLGDGLESAMDLFLRIVPELSSLESSKTSLRKIVVHAAWVLTDAIVRIPKADPKPRFVQPFSIMMRDFRPGPLFHATLGVYGQKRPDPQPALTYFQKMPANTIVNMDARMQSRSVLLGLRAAELLLQDERHIEALWIMEILQANFAKEIGSPLPQIRKTPTSQSEKRLYREEKSLHLLDTLAID